MKSEFISAITQLSAEKNVPREVVLEAIKAALVSAYKRNFPSGNAPVVVDIDPGSGGVKIFEEREVVEELPEDPTLALLLPDARRIEPDANIGDVVRIDVTPPPAQFGRIAAQTAKQVVNQKIRDAERKLVYDEFTEREGEIVHGVVQRVEQGNVIFELGRAEAVMPRNEQIPVERYFPGQRARVYVSEVHDTHRGPQIIVSRAHRFMLRRLLEQEVPEIYNGQVEIKAIAREAGFRSKVAVVARQEGLDPVGSCVGMRGVRIQNIVNELAGEKIDVVEWSEDQSKYVANALSPAQVLNVTVDEDDKTARVVVPERQLSLAIGKEGQNARLAAKLTGWRIDIKSDAQVAAEALSRPIAETESSSESERSAGIEDGSEPGEDSAVVADDNPAATAVEDMQVEVARDEAVAAAAEVTAESGADSDRVAAET